MEQRRIEWDHKRMVPTLSSYTERLAYVAKACQYPTDAAFAAAIGVKPQNLNNWRQRDSVGKDSLAKIKAATGASLDWLTTGKGDPFPGGPVFYAGAAPTSPEALGRIADLERDVEHLVSAVTMLVTRLAESVPAAGAAMAADLRGYLSKAGRPSAVLPELLQAADAARVRASPGAGGKKPRTSR